MFSFQKKRASKEPILDKKYEDVGIFLTNPLRLQQLEIIQLTERDLQYVRSVKQLIEVRVKEVVEAFYATIGSVPEFQEIIREHSTTERLSQTLRHHVIEMLEGRIDDEYIEKRKRVSLVHVHIGLTTKWYLAAFQKLESTIREIVRNLNIPTEEKVLIIEAVSKICSFEQQIVLEEYERVSAKIVDDQQNNVKRNVREVIGGISHKLEHQSQETSGYVSELIHSTKSVNEQLQRSMHEAQSMQLASQHGYVQMQRLSEQTSEINDKTVEMADQTKQSVEQIAVLIGGSSAVTTQVIHSIHHIQNLVEEGMGQNEQSLTAFENISKSIEMTIRDFEHVAQKVLNLSTIAEQIGDSTERLEEASATLEQTIATF